MSKENLSESGDVEKGQLESVIISFNEDPIEDWLLFEKPKVSDNSKESLKKESISESNLEKEVLNDIQESEIIEANYIKQEQQSFTKSITTSIIIQPPFQLKTKSFSTSESQTDMVLYQSSESQTIISIFSLEDREMNTEDCQLIDKINVKQENGNKNWHADRKFQEMFEGLLKKRNGKKILCKFMRMTNGLSKALGELIKFHSLTKLSPALFPIEESQNENAINTTEVDQNVNTSSVASMSLERMEQNKRNEYSESIFNDNNYSENEEISIYQLFSQGKEVLNKLSQKLQEIAYELNEDEKLVWLKRDPKIYNKWFQLPNEFFDYPFEVFTIKRKTNNIRKSLPDYLNSRMSSTASFADLSLNSYGELTDEVFLNANSFDGPKKHANVEYNVWISLPNSMIEFQHEVFLVRVKRKGERSQNTTDRNSLAGEEFGSKSLRVNGNLNKPISRIPGYDYYSTENAVPFQTRKAWCEINQNYMTEVYKKDKIKKLKPKYPFSQSFVESKSAYV